MIGRTSERLVIGSVWTLGGAASRSAYAMNGAVTSSVCCGAEVEYVLIRTLQTMSSETTVEDIWLDLPLARHREPTLWGPRSRPSLEDWAWHRDLPGDSRY